MISGCLTSHVENTPIQYLVITCAPSIVTSWWVAWKSLYPNLGWFSKFTRIFLGWNHQPDPDSSDENHRTSSSSICPSHFSSKKIPWNLKCPIKFMKNPGVLRFSALFVGEIFSGPSPRQAPRFRAAPAARRAPNRRRPWRRWELPEVADCWGRNIK